MLLAHGRLVRHFTLLCACLLWAVVGRATEFDPVRFVDPFIGTGGHGHTYPGATLPFGMVQLSPDTRLDGWDGCSLYHDDDDRVFGFSHTHLSGTGVGDYGDVLFLPARGTPHWHLAYGRPAGAGEGSRFRKATETASPGYYAVTLDDPHVRVELTATPRTGWHRYTFAPGDSAFVLVDLRSRDEVIAASLRVVNDHEIEGERRSRGWARDQRLFFVARFSRPFHALLAIDSTAAPGRTEASGRDLQAALEFALRRGGVVVAKVGLSAVDVTGARAALDAEAPGWSFDSTRAAARGLWRQALARIEIQGGTPAQDTTFYTALYHTLLQPNLYQDVDGRYRGHDGAVHKAQGWTPYTVFSLWDTFRAAHPLYTLLEPARTRDFVRTFLAQYEQSGRLPVWELAGNETDCMIGYHAVSVIADAYAKGIRDFDTNEALAAMRASAEADARGLADYKRRGYVPGERESESVSKTLEYAYDDACIARFADAIGRPAVRDSFLLRAQAWRHVCDPATGFMRPRIGARFKTPFDPTEVDFHFTEANSWQYSFFVPQDIEGHMAALGGRARYALKLDSLFGASPHTSGREQADITGLIGQYAHGNEPSHHIAYLYDYAGQPWKTQQIVRRILDSLYTPRHDGLAGNEDCGQMSAWYVLSALGFYAVTPGQDAYAIGTPLFPKATLHLPSGKDFTITAAGGGTGRPYIRSASLAGRPFDRCSLTQGEITAGGALAFTMSATPERAWAAAPGAAPASRLGGPRVVPAPYVTAGLARFRGAQRVAFACADTSARIRYGVYEHDSLLVRGTGTSVTIDRTATIRLRAFAPGADASPEEEASFRHIADDRRVVSVTVPHRAYTADGPDALIDGVRGGDDFRLPTWMGFYGTDMDAVVDLGAERALDHLATGFLQDQNSWIFMPRGVRYQTSLDGTRYEAAGEVANTVDEHAEGVVIRDFAVRFAPRRARYVRVHATAPIQCPGWHKGAGNRSFIFADEIVFE